MSVAVQREGEETLSKREEDFRVKMVQPQEKRHRVAPEQWNQVCEVISSAAESERAICLWN